MRGLVKTPFVGGLMILLAISMAFYFHQTEITKNRTLLSLAQHAQSVQDIGTVLYDLYSLEKVFITEDIIQTIEGLSAAEASTLENNWMLLIPTTDYLHQIQDMHNSQGYIELSAEYDPGTRKERILTYGSTHLPMVLIEQNNATYRLEFVQQGAIFEVSPTDRNYIIPVPLETLAKVIKALKDYQLKLDSYVGVYPSTDRFYYHPPSTCVCINGVSYCSSNDLLISTYDALVSYTNTLTDVARGLARDIIPDESEDCLNGYILNYVQQTLPPEESIYVNNVTITCDSDKTENFLTPWVDLNYYNCNAQYWSVISPVGYKVRAVTCTAEINLDYPGIGYITVNYEFTKNIEPVFNQEPQKGLLGEVNNGNLYVYDYLGCSGP